MKIIVDEMPKSAEDCVFGTGEYDRCCVINNRNYCYDSENCQYLKSMTDIKSVAESEDKCENNNRFFRIGTSVE